MPTVVPTSEASWAAPGLATMAGAARAVGGEGAVQTLVEGALHVAQSRCSAARAGATDGVEAEACNGAGDKLAVEALADEDGDTHVAETPRAGQQRPMPEGVDAGS